VADDDLIASCKGDDLFKKRLPGNGGGGVVGIIEEKEFGLFCDGLWNL
jgi:hypothetical protein